MRYVQQELPLVVCFSVNLKACHEYCVFLRGKVLLWSHKIKWKGFFSQPGQGCLFSLMSAVSFIVSLQQYFVLMVHDLYRPDACLYSTKREDLA